MAMRQTPLTCSGHTRPVVDLAFSGITPYGYFLISACKGEPGRWFWFADVQGCADRGVEPAPHGAEGGAGVPTRETRTEAWWPGFRSGGPQKRFGCLPHGRGWSPTKAADFTFIAVSGEAELYTWPKHALANKLRIFQGFGQWTH